MPDTSTVFQAEIEAISHACQYALANLKDLNINYIKILSDSKAAIKALNKPRITSQSVLTALEFMETLALEVNPLRPRSFFQFRPFRPIGRKRPMEASFLK